MKKVLAIALSLALAFPAASLLAQQAPAKVQPVQVAQTGGEAAGLMGMSMGATIAVVVAVAIAVAAANSNDSVLPATASATATR